LRYLVGVDCGGDSTVPIDHNTELSESLASVLHDKMTQCTYKQPLESFDVDVKPDQWFEVDVLSEGRSALEKVNKDLGLAFDDWDLDYYTKLFSDHLKRNPTSVECFDLAQSNSEHSRHWFFRGKMIIDGEKIQDSLMEMVKKTSKLSNDNSVIRLADNSRYVFLCIFLHVSPIPFIFTDILVKRHSQHCAKTCGFSLGILVSFSRDC
jgi:phosphoribosylformylglycinamidine synthase